MSSPGYSSWQCSECHAAETYPLLDRDTKVFCRRITDVRHGHICGAPMRLLASVEATRPAAADLTR